MRDVLNRTHLKQIILILMGLLMCVLTPAPAPLAAVVGIQTGTSQASSFIRPIWLDLISETFDNYCETHLLDISVA